MSYDLNPKTTINISFNRQRQYSHLLSYTESEGYFREFYTTSDGLTPPSLSHQWSLGWYYHFKDRTIWLSDANVSIELFYKRQSRLNKFLPGIDPDLSVVEYDDNLLRNGKAQTYGLEFLFQKTAGKFHGSLAYTYAHSRARYSGYNNGEAFNADFDYRHNINVLLIYKFRKGYKLSALWDYRSGRPMTLTTSQSSRDDIISMQVIDQNTMKRYESTVVFLPPKPEVNKFDIECTSNQRACFVSAELGMVDKPISAISITGRYLDTTLIDNYFRPLNSRLFNPDLIYPDVDTWDNYLATSSFFRSIRPPHDAQDSRYKVRVSLAYLSYDIDQLIREINGTHAIGEDIFATLRPFHSNFSNAFGVFGLYNEYVREMEL